MYNVLALDRVCLRLRFAEEENKNLVHYKKHGGNREIAAFFIKKPQALRALRQCLKRPLVVDNLRPLCLSENSPI